MRSSCSLLGSVNRLATVTAMLGYFDIVSAVLSDFPEMRDALGPHGIPLVEHARAGGADSRAVLELLEATEASV